MGGNGREDSPSSSTAASESEAVDAVKPSGFAAAASATLTGAGGKFLANELARWRNTRSQSSTQPYDRDQLSAWEHVERGVERIYDRPLSGAFNFLYDILQFSSGRDKLCALMQGYAKFASAARARPDSERYYMYRGIEDSLSDGRKIFRLFKEYREVYKIRRGVHRMMEGISEAGFPSVPAICGCLDVCGHTASFFYYLFDNLLWAASVGMVRAKEVPQWQKQMWQGFRKNGPTLRRLGGVAQVKRMKNLASIWRLHFAALANILLLRAAVQQMSARGASFEGHDDARLFHTLELVGMFASYRLLLSKLGYVKMKSHAKMGLLAMLGAATGLHSTWRKVVRKKCASKLFVTTVERRLARSKSLNDLSAR